MLTHGPVCWRESFFSWWGTFFFNYYFFKKYKFIYLLLRWVLVAVRGLSLVAASGGYCFVAVRGLLIAMASLVVEHGL